MYLESFTDVASPGVGERRDGPDGGPEPGDADCRQIVDLYLESFSDVASPGVGERRDGPDGGPEPGDADEQPM